jgi:hypothetical protein
VDDDDTPDERAFKMMLKNEEGKGEDPEEAVKAVYNE